MACGEPPWSHVFYNSSEAHCNRVYMGTEAYKAFTQIYLREENALTANPPGLLAGLPIVVLDHLPPDIVYCQGKDITEIVRKIGNELMHQRLERTAWFKDQQRGNQPEQATSIYRLEEPNRIWAMVLMGMGISWIIGLLYAWKIGLLILGR